MTVEALNCPNCGGGVASDSRKCEFCKTRLKTMACPSCFGLMFVGSKFCGHCGAIAAPLEVSLDQDAGECPRCRRGLEILKIDATSLGSCSKCDGLWVDTATFESICSNNERQSAVLGFLKDRTLPPAQLTKVSYVPCPDCGELMNRNNFAKASGVIVDICKQHGVWLDADELPAVIEFIRKGGMDITRERERAEIKNERDRLREEQRKHSVEDRRFGAIFADGEKAGIRKFIRTLFD